MPYVVSDEEIAMLVANISFVNDDIANLNRLLTVDVCVMSLVLITILILICFELYHVFYQNSPERFGCKSNSREKYGTSLLSDSDHKGASV
jgi:hypothetical protein